MGISKTKIYPKWVFAELNKNYSFYEVISDVRIYMQQSVLGKVMALFTQPKEDTYPNSSNVLIWCDRDIHKLLAYYNIMKNSNWIIDYVSSLRVENTVNALTGRKTNIGMFRKKNQYLYYRKNLRFLWIHSTLCPI